MNKDTLKLFHQRAIKSLSDNSLQTALNYIKSILLVVNQVELDNERDSIQTDYDMMTGFMQQGGTDPQRDSIYMNLVKRSYSLLEKVVREYRIQHENDLYTEAYKQVAAKNFTQLTNKILILQKQLTGNNQDTVLIKEQDALHEAYDDLFDYLWTAPLLNTDTMKEWSDFLEGQNEHVQSVCISAIMLSNQNYFDPLKIGLLLHFCKNTSSMVRTRALTAIIWAYMQFEHQFMQYPDLLQVLSQLAADPQMLQELILLQTQFILSQETQRALERLQKGIFPKIMHMQQSDGMSIKAMEEEFDKLLRKEADDSPNSRHLHKQFEKQMNEIIEMKSEGIDINIGTFYQLKYFPFFKRTSHWFVPFDEHRKEVYSVLSDRETGSPLRTIMSAGNLCASDKYSLCLMVDGLTSLQRDMLIRQLKIQMDGQEEFVDANEKENDNIIYVYRNYLHDLYRFYKYFPQKEQFEDPFKRDLLYTRYNFLGNLVKSPEYLKDMASFLIKKKYYSDAIDYLDEVLKEETATADILKNKAFCYQNLDNPGTAIYYYQQADLLLPDNEWILKQLFLCYSAMDKYEQGLPYLKRLEAINPEDENTIGEIGLCLMKMKRYEEAVKYFYRMEYNGMHIFQSRRAIAWCNFKMNKLEQAYKYYQKILEDDKASWEDYLNIGHTLWCMNNIQEAIVYYRKYIHTYPVKKDEDPLQAFNNDKKELMEHGISSLDIDIIRDIIFPKPLPEA